MNFGISAWVRQHLFSWPSIGLILVIIRLVRKQRPWSKYWRKRSSNWARRTRKPSELDRRLDSRKVTTRQLASTVRGCAIRAGWPFLIELFATTQFEDLNGDDGDQSYEQPRYPVIHVLAWHALVHREFKETIRGDPLGSRMVMLILLDVDSLR